MMVPYVQQELEYIENRNGYAVYKVEFAIPEKYGIFKFTLHHSESGYSFVKLEKEVIVRPRDTDETPRFLKIHLPYYLSTLSMMIGAVFIGIITLHSPLAKKEKCQ